MKRGLKLLKGVLLMGAVVMTMASFPFSSKAAGYSEIGQYGRPMDLVYEVEGDSNEQIEEEIKLGDMELIAQLVEAEAGNQDLYGKRLVVDVVLNRVESPDFPNTVEEVIFQKGQFSVVTNGAFEKAAYNMKESDYMAVAMEYELHSNKDVLYFNNSSKVSGTGTPFKVGGHWFND